MALTTAIEMQLQNAGLIKEFEGKRQIWLEMAREAYKYTCATVVGDPKQDDVSPHLALALQTRDDFIRAKDARKLTAKRWFQNFADLIVARTWTEITAETKQEDNGG